MDALAEQPVFHLLRKYKGEIDLLAILRTRACRYSCAFCDLAVSDDHFAVNDEQVLSQFEAIVETYAESLDVIDRVSISNQGSVLDETTLNSTALHSIIDAVQGLPALSRLVLETRPELIDPEKCMDISERAGKLIVDYLIGFETLDDKLRNVTLGKRQDRSSVIDALDAIASTGNGEVTFYVLLKPSLSHTDSEAVDEAKSSIEYLKALCRDRGVAISVRINPMYVAANTRWGKKAIRSDYTPPRLSDAIEVAEWAEGHGISSYIGLSDEGLAGGKWTYRVREDFSKDLLIRAININARPFNTVLAAWDLS